MYPTPSSDRKLYPTHGTQSPGTHSGGSEMYPSDGTHIPQPDQPGVSTVYLLHV